MKKSSAGNGLKRWSIFSSMALRPGKLKALLTAAVMLGVPVHADGRAETRLTLPEAIRLSQEHSYSIRSWRYDSLSSAYDLRAAQSLRFPTASLTGTAFHINKLQSIDLPFERISIGTHDNYQVDFRLSMPLLTGGRIRNQIQMQRQVTVAKSLDLDADRLNNAYLTRKAYLSFMASTALANSVTSSLERVELIVRDVQNRFVNGLADSVDLLEADLALQKATQARNAQLTASTNAEAALGRLIGLPPRGRIGFADSVPAPDYSLYDGRSLAIEEINRPELKAFDNRVRAAQLAADLSKSNYYPTLNGYSGYSIGKPNKDLFNKTWNDYWTFGLLLNWDFNLGGGLINKSLSARQAANSAQMLRKDLEESLLLQANLAFENLSLAMKSYDLSKKQFEIARQEYHLAQNQFDAGRISLNRLLEIEKDLRSTEDLYRASTIGYFLAETEYLYAIGSPKIYGGF